MDEATMHDSVVQSSKVRVFSMFYSMMNHNAPRRYSQGRNFGVDRQQDFAADIVPRRPYAPYDKRMKKGQNKWSRNLVWTSKEFQASEGNRPRMDNTNGSTIKPPVLGRGYNVSNQPKKNAAYGPRSSSVSETRGWGSSGKVSPKTKECVCKFWKAGNCKKGEQCPFLHSWSCFPGLAMVASLEGHKKDIKGIALPQGSDKLFSASIDGTLCIWDCNTGQCVHTINLQAEAGSLISEGPWVFLGLPNAVKAFNVQNSKDLHLNGVVGQVHAMTIANGMLFAGTSSGSISVWKATDTESEPFTYLTSLEGHHSGQVTCFIIGGQRLYSGSVDKTIKVWDLNTLQCKMTLMQHTDTVTSLLCWDQFLISSSLDGTIRVLACSENGSLKVTNTRRQEQAFNVQTSKDLRLNGVVGQVHAMTITNGMLFAGTSSGSISVWIAIDTESEPFTYLTSLEGDHTGQVTCFIVGGQRLYSGSVDKTIKVWDLNTLQCTMTLRQHTNTVTSLLCWDQFLISPVVEIRTSTATIGEVLAELRDAIKDLKHVIGDPKDPLKKLEKKCENNSKFVLFIGGLTGLTNLLSPPGGLDSYGLIRFRYHHAYLCHFLLTESIFALLTTNYVILLREPDEDFSNKQKIAHTKRKLIHSWILLWVTGFCFLALRVAGFWLIYPQHQHDPASPPLPYRWPRYLNLRNLNLFTSILQAFAIPTYYIIPKLIRFVIGVYKSL